MVSIKTVDEIIKAVLERVGIEGSNIEDAYPDISVSERNELISIIKDLVEYE